MFLGSMLGAGIFTTIGLILKYTASIIIGVFKFLLFMPLYLIFMGVMMIATFAEMTFKKLAGIDTIYLNGEGFGGGSGDGKDLVYAFITDSAVQDVFWSIVGLSIILLFIFTIVAMIKSEFTIDLKGSAKGPIISRALKSLVNLLVVPVVTIISIFGTNFLTTTIYELFTPEGQSVVTKCFQVGAYNANRARSDPEFVDSLENLLTSGGGQITSGSSEEVAKAIDKYFMDYADVSTEFKDYSFIDLLEAIDDGDLTKGSIDSLFFGIPKPSTFFSLFKMSQVAIFYDMAKFDWILAIGSGIVVTWTLLSVCLVLVKRVFELCILFLLAPPMTAIAPLDGGQAEKKWRSEFMKRLLAVIAPIFAYNMYFLLIPLFENISLFSGVKMAIGAGTVTGGVSMLGSYQLAITDFLFIFDIFFQLICVIVGLGILKSASALLSNLLGVEDLVKSGGEAAKKAVDVGKKAALGATAIGGMAIKGGAAAIKGAKALKDGVKNRMSEGGKSAAKAKKELKGAEKDAESADNTLADATKAEEEARAKVEESKDYKNATADIEKLEETKRNQNGVLTEDQQKELAAAYKARGDLFAKDKNLQTATQARKDAEQKSKNAHQSVENRRSGISSDMEKTLKKLDSGRDATTGRFVTKEEAEKGRARAKNIREQASKGGIGDHVKAAYDSEFGEDAGTTSVAAKASTWINKKAKKWSEKHPLLSTLPIIQNIPALTNSLQEQFAISGDTAKRRLNDGLAGMFGEGGGGDLWKIWFNKNARAGLYEGVPESKTRSANIEQSLSWGARDKWEKDNRAKQEREETLQLIRRMLARDRGGEFADKYEREYKKLENETNPAQIKSIKAKIEKMEIEGGITSAARNYYDGLTPGSAKSAALAKFKDEMQADATKRELAKKADAEQKTLQANIQTGAAPLETKITERSAEQVARAIQNALAGGKGIKISQGEKGALKIEGLAETLAGVTEGINSLSEALKVLSDLSGKTGADAGGNKPENK